MAADPRPDALPLPDDAPPELAAALAERGARLVEVEPPRRQHPSRTYMRFESPRGDLHGYFSADPVDEPALAYEAEVRAIVGTEGRLRAPPILAHGPGWMLSVTIEPTPPDEGALELVVDAAARIAELELPPAPPAKGRSRTQVVLRRLKLLRSPLPSRDLVRAKLLLERTTLPTVTSHGGYQRRHVFFADGAAWVIDWELSGRRPAGYDLMHYWTSLSDAEARASFFERAVALVGREHRRELERLRYALVVRTIAGKLADDDDFAGAVALLAVLPEVRAHVD